EPLEQEAAPDGQVVAPGAKNGVGELLVQSRGDAAEEDDGCRPRELHRVLVDGAIPGDDAVADDELGGARGLDAAAVVGGDFDAVERDEAVCLDGAAAGVSAQVDAFEEEGGAVVDVEGGAAAGGTNYGY